MESLIKTSSDITVTYTQKDTYLCDVAISGNIKGKTFGCFMYGSNKNNGGITSYFKDSGGTTNKVNCEVTNSSYYQYQNSNSGYDCWMGGGYSLPLITQA